MAKIDSQKIARILASAPPSDDDIDVKLDDIDSLGNNEHLVKMFKNIASYNRMLKERITFVNSALTSVIPFTKGNLYLICAYSGSGKSTLAANVSFPLWKQQKKVLVVSNEESEHDVLLRIACLEKGYNFNDFKKGTMPLVQQQDCLKIFKDIAPFIKVIDVNYSSGRIPNVTSTLEGVKKLLDTVKTADYSCVLIDYYQLIRKSLRNPGASTYEVLNDFRLYLQQYIASSQVPVVVFAQLHSLGKRNNKDLDSRIKNGPEIYEPSTVVIEVVPNFQEKISDFIIHKDRFGFAGQRVTCAFDRGRFLTIDPAVLEQIKINKVNDLTKLVDGEDAKEDE